MNGSRAVLMLEFNELSPRLMDRFIAEGRLPNFARLRSESFVAITDPGESQDGLEPWIQWVTVHTGVGRTEHGIEKLGEADRLQHPTIGAMVSDAGRGVLLCGSMNLPRRAAGIGVFLPDPWNPDSTPHPESMRAFSDFVRANVQEHSNEAARLTPRSVAAFGWHLARHGLSPTTVAETARQLVGERRGKRRRWARASVLDRLQWDLFRWWWQKEKPAFATFFSNSTAHYQHVYWRNLEPEAFVQKPTPEDQERFAGAVAHGYEQMDFLVGEALALADESSATLVFCTGLSQQPYVHAEETGGKYIYRPRRFEDVIDALGIQGVRQVAPVMAEQFHLYFDSDDAVSDAEVALRSASIDGRPAFVVRTVERDVFVGCSVHDVVSDDARLRTPSGVEVPFLDLFYRSDSPKSGFHHPDGMLWIRTGRHEEAADAVPLRSVAPTILGLLGVPIPDSMTASPIETVLPG